MSEDTARLEALRQTLTDVRVLVAEVRGDTSAILGRLTELDRRGEDHEARIRTLEAHGCAGHSERLDDLEKWRWKTVGVLLAITSFGGAGGMGIALVAKSLLAPATGH